MSLINSRSKSICKCLALFGYLTLVQALLFSSHAMAVKATADRKLEVSSNRSYRNWEVKTAPLALFAKWITIDIAYR